MKPKYFGLAGIGLAVIATGATLWFEIFWDPVQGGGTGFRSIAPVADIAVPDKAVLDKMDRLEHSMPILAAPMPHMREPSDLSAFGYAEVAPTERRLVPGSDGHGLTASHRLSLAFEGRAKRFCVIDNRLYTEGALLPDGATIVRIESRRVLIAKKSIQQWLAMDPLPEDEVSQES
jgi:hypothetical protein